MTEVKTRTDTRVVLKTPSMWKVLIHNDDFTPMEFVTEVLKHVFHKSHDEAVALMLTVHHTGRGNVGLYTKEVAATKALQVRLLAEANGHPLLATAEEA